MDSCTLTAEVTGRQHLRSATQRKLVVPRYRLNSFGRRRYSVAGPSTWNSLPDSLRDPELSLDTFKRQLKTYIFAKYWWQNVFSALEIFLSMHYINLHFTYLLTYASCPSVCPSIYFVLAHNPKTKSERKPELTHTFPRTRVDLGLKNEPFFSWKFRRMAACAGDIFYFLLFALSTKACTTALVWLTLRRSNANWYIKWTMYLVQTIHINTNTIGMN